MTTATVTTGWHGTGTSIDPYRPAVADDYSLQSWTDLTGADPRLGQPATVQIVAADATVAAIQTDPRYAGKVTLQTKG